MSVAQRGRIISEEHKTKLSAAHRTSEKAKAHREKLCIAQKKAVEALDADGNVVLTFSSTAEAGRNGFDQSNVAACCRGKIKTHRGLHWRYVV